MAYWLMKSEPDAYSWVQLQKDKRTPWNGVRNYLANNNMKAMKLGDEAFFYHSGPERSIIGVMKVVKTWYLDPSDKTGRFGMVDVVPIHALPSPVSLAMIKEDKELKQMVFVRQSRLSVSPVSEQEWNKISQMHK